MEERGAVERLKRGDIGGLEVLVGLHQVRAVRAAYLILRDRSSAEDVVQGAFLRACEKIGSFGEGGPFGPWFTKVVVNDAINAARGSLLEELPGTRAHTGALGRGESARPPGRAPLDARATPAIKPFSQMCR